MMKDNLPKILEQCLQNNQPDINIITNKLKLPWLKLQMPAPVLTDQYVNSTETSAHDWRALWEADLAATQYQVKGWNGNMLFGPTNMKEFLTNVSQHKEWTQNDYDEDCQCKFFRNKFEYSWRVDQQDPIRKWVNQLVDDHDINIVNTYFLPPGGFVYPHRDYSFFKDGLAKIYIPVQWESGSRFGMYGVGDIPLAQGDVYLINNYSLPHWVFNGSTQRRMVISIGANLDAPALKSAVVDSFRLTFGITDQTH